MKLIIAEKPSVARDIAAVLGKPTRKEGFLEVGEYFVTYAIGHLIGLADADAYDPRYKSWRAEDLPILPETFQLVVLEHAKRQYNVVAKLLKGAREVIVATDAGREGQLIYELIARHTGYKGLAKRLWLSSLTDRAIGEAFLNLRDNREYQPLYEAAVSRAEADWLVGINATRCMTVRAGTKLPIGRVQTPTLAMIVERDEAIERFIVTPYFEVMATFSTVAGSYKGKWTKNKQSRFDHQADATAIADKVRGKRGHILRVETKPKSEAPPQLFDLTALQRRANQLWGMTAEQTLKTVQSLYETHKVLTYPRTDSRYISRDIVPTLPDRLRAAAAFTPDLSSLLDVVSNRPSSRVVSDEKVTDHHAIIPTDKKPSGSLKAEERNIYELVSRQTFAALLPAAQWSITTIETVVDDELFVTRGRILLSPGWRAALKEAAERERGESSDDEMENSLLPPVERGQEAKTLAAEVLAKQTKPPAHFTEASLLAAMESAGKQVDDAALAEAMKERGLGTPATRAATIEKLKRDGLIQVQKKQLSATMKARELIAAIPLATLKSPELTGEWESKLKQMERGHYSRKDFIQEIEVFTKSIIEHLSHTSIQISAPVKERASTRQAQSPDADTAPSEEKSLGQCPMCGAPMKESVKAYGCSEWQTGCTFTVWKEIAGHKVTQAQVRDLLAKGITRPLKFKSKAGKPFDAQLRLVEGGKTTFVFAKGT